MYAVTKDGKSAKAIGGASEIDVNETPFSGDLPFLSDNRTLAFVIDTRSQLPRLPTTDEWLAMETARVTAELLYRINELRFTHESAGFDFIGKRFDSDQRSYNRIAACALGAVTSLMLGAPFAPIAWKTADNDEVVLDAQGVIGMFAALLEHGRVTHAYTQTLKASVIAGEKVDIEANWPT